MKYTYEEIESLAASNSDLNVSNLDEAYSYCKKLATSHYENFPVGSVLIPKHLRKYFYSIYAFSRLCDDIADENLEIEKSERYGLLNQIENNLVLPSSSLQTPILKAVVDTTIRTKIETTDLIRLNKAFKQDIYFHHAETFEELLDYCDYSANPVGEMILKLFDNNNAEAVAYSDDICTALQLVNFWQDISRDIEKGRCFIPSDYLEKYHLDCNNLSYNIVNFNVCMNQLYAKTEKLFEKGINLLYLVKNKRLKFELKLIISSGIRILEKCRISEDKIISKRPALNKVDYIGIILKSLTL
jgi:squalene synthase HpnC